MTETISVKSSSQNFLIEKISLQNFFTEKKKISVTKFSDDQYCDGENSITNPSVYMICDGIVKEIFVTIFVFSCSEITPYEALYGRPCRPPVCWMEVGKRPSTGPDLIRDTSEKVDWIRS